MVNTENFPKIRSQPKMLTSGTSMHTSFILLVVAIKQEKDVRGRRLRNEKFKCCVFPLYCLSRYSIASTELMK